jgi:hypothetical protein
MGAPLHKEVLYSHNEVGWTVKLHVTTKIPGTEHELPHATSNTSLRLKRKAYVVIRGNCFVLRSGLGDHHLLSVALRFL